MRPTLALCCALLACGEPPSAPPTPPTPAPPTEEPPAAPTTPILATPRLRVDALATLLARDAQLGVGIEVRNRGDAQLRIDLRFVDRVIAARPSAPHMPLTEEELGALSTVSALTPVAPGASVRYAVPLSSCEPGRPIALTGVLVVTDGERVSELIADGVEVEVACDASPTPLPRGTVWVDALAPAGSAPARALDTYLDELPPMVRAAAVDPEAEIALLPFSYDARPIERFRYDACVALGRCPARTVAQPSGSLRSPAVGMSWEAAEAFCASRSLHVASERERAVIADPARDLVPGDGALVVRAGFVCARPEPI